MSIITSISVRNEDWEYLRERKLSPTALFKIGLERSKNIGLDEYDISDEEKLTEQALMQKIERLLGAIKILTERAERAEQMVMQQRNLIGGYKDVRI